MLLSIGEKNAPFNGVSNLISSEKLPPYMFQKLINLEPAIEIGKLKKRKGYGNILTGQTNLAVIKELVDKNGGRQLFIQQGTNIRESVYSGGYGALAAVSNDERTAGSTIYRIRPNVFENILRSGAGLNASTDLPIWFGYKAAQTRFPNDATPITVAAGKYLDEQFYNDKISSLLSFSTWFDTFESELASTGVTKGTYLIYITPVIDGNQRGFPDLNIANATEGVKMTYDYGSFQWEMQIAAANTGNHPRLTAFDVFIADLGNFGSGDLEIYPAYFLQRVYLTQDSETILELEGTLQTATPPTHIEFDDDFSTWETFKLSGFHANFTTPQDTYDIQLGARVENVNKVRYGVSGLDNLDSGESVTVKIYSKWYESGGNYYYRMVYDDYHRKLGSEMYTHLNIPAGDLGLSDNRYKYGCESNKVFFIFGRSDGFGYYSKRGEPDVIPSLNIIKPHATETGCLGMDNFVLLFSKHKSEFIEVFGNQSMRQTGNLNNVGCVGQDSIKKISEDFAVWMSYKGPQQIVGRQISPLGGSNHLKKWWEETLSDSEKESITIDYNYLRDQIWIFCPDYSDTDFPNGIIFVYDLNAARAGFGSAWFYFSSDIGVLTSTLNDDGHLLSANATTIVDWNASTANETDISTLVKLLVLKGQVNSKRAKPLFKMCFLDIETDDTIAARIYEDGSGTPVTLTIDTTSQEAYIRYLSESLELEVLTEESGNTVEINKLQIEIQPRRF